MTGCGFQPSTFQPSTKLLEVSGRQDAYGLSNKKRSSSYGVERMGFLAGFL
jgi:hypothetical protein